MIKVAIDAMGGDESPEAIVKGAIESLGETEDTKLFLFGPKERISALLSQYSFDGWSLSMRRMWSLFTSPRCLRSGERRIPLL